MKGAGNFNPGEHFRNTKHKKEIIGILEKSELPVTAEEMFIQLKKKNKSICLSTVYRIFDTLTAIGLVIKSNLINDNKSRFEINRKEHKHIVVCVGCRKMINISDCPFEDFDKKLKNKLGFDVTSHRLEIYGYCSDCLNKPVI